MFFYRSGAEVFYCNRRDFKQSTPTIRKWWRNLIKEEDDYPEMVELTIPQPKDT